MKKICIISADPNFLGGVSLYTWNTINSLGRLKGFEVFWVYEGKRNRIYKKGGVTLVELKSIGKYPFSEIFFNFRVKKFLDKNYFDIINSHAIWGFWIKFYRKKENQKIIHTYHGSTYYFFKNHLKRSGIIKKIGSLFSMFLGLFMEKPPWKKADRIICVSEHVKIELEGLYGKRKNIEIINAGVDIKKFRPRNKKSSKKEVGLDPNKWYGLYVGRGGFWTKGLDRVINLSKEIYKKDENYRLIIIGSERDKVKNIINKKFIVFLPSASREILPYYYNSADIFFNLSRYEGGDPTLSTAEAMASGCLIVCSEDAKQEIIKDRKNGIILKKFDITDAKNVVKISKSQKLRKGVIKNSIRMIRKSSIKNRNK